MYHNNLILFFKALSKSEIDCTLMPTIHFSRFCECYLLQAVFPYLFPKVQHFFILYKDFLVVHAFLKYSNSYVHSIVFSVIIGRNINITSNLFICQEIVWHLMISRILKRTSQLSNLYPKTNSYLLILCYLILYTLYIVSK